MRGVYKEIEVELDDDDIEFYLKDMKDDELRRIGFIRTSTKANLDDVKKDFVEFLKVYKPDVYSYQDILLDKIKKVLDL